MQYNLPQFFLSYAHKDLVHFNSFKDHLLSQTYDKWEIWKDDNIKIGEKWDSAIYQAIEGTQFSILCLSDNFLDSLYIKQNEIPIIVYKNLNDKCRFFPFYLANCSKDKLNKLSDYQIFLPSELQQITEQEKIVSFEDCKTDVEKLKFVSEFINRINKTITEENIEINNIINWRNDYVKKIKKSIYTAINPNSNYHSTRTGVADESSIALTTEIPQIFQSNYKLEVDAGNSYLKRAIRLFEPAQSIFAVSLYSVSTFWKEEESRFLRDKYLEVQSNDKNKVVFRLFVFNNISEIKEYKEILKIHYDKYGKKESGGVFLCSKEDYKNLLREYTIQSLDDDLNENSDFAILDYKEEYPILIKLKSKSFNFSDINFSDKIECKNRFTKFCKELLLLNEWEIKSKFNVLKWGSLDIDKQKLNNSLRSFSKEIKKQTKHILFINNINAEKNNLRKAFIDIKEKFNNSDLKNSILKIEFLEKGNIVATDGRFGCRLKSKLIYEYCLIMDFEDEKDLKSFYSSNESSMYREEIYKIINPPIEKLYDQIKTLGKDEEDKICNIMDEIESKMEAYISRMDFVVKDPVEEVMEFLLK